MDEIKYCPNCNHIINNDVGFKIHHKKCPNCNIYFCYLCLKILKYYKHLIKTNHISINENYHSCPYFCKYECLCYNKKNIILKADDILFDL